MPIILSPSPDTVAFTTMATPISAYVSGCPTSVIALVVKKIITDLCDRARVWREYSTPVTLVSGTPTYTLAPVSTHGEINSIYSASTTVSSNKKVIKFLLLDALQARYPTWPEDAPGDAEVFTKVAARTVSLAPVPDAAGTMTAYVGLRPTPASTVWDSALYSEHYRVIFHGVLHDLMLMPGRDWEDKKTGAYHGKQWMYLLEAARARANLGFNPSSLGVTMAPMA